MAITKSEVLKKLRDFALEAPTFDIWGLTFGEYKSRRSGEGIEFKEFTRYEDGEDIAKIDPRASARLGYPVIRQNFTEEKILRVLALDDSLSLDHYDMRGAALLGLGCYLISAAQFRDPAQVIAARSGDDVWISGEIYTHDDAVATIEELWDKIRNQKRNGAFTLKKFTETIAKNASLQNSSLLLASDFAWSDAAMKLNKREGKLIFQNYENVKNALSALSGEVTDVAALGISPDWKVFSDLRGFFRASDSESGGTVLKFFSKRKARKLIELSIERERLWQETLRTHGLPLSWIHARSADNIIEEMLKSH